MPQHVLRILASLSLACTLTAGAQSAPSPAQARAERAFAAARKAGAPSLYAFLKPFPKGADLHMHLSGAVYAETFLREAAAQHFCIDTTRLALIKDPAASKNVPSQPGCPGGAIPAADALKDQQLYDRLINSFSMRSFVPSAGFSGHDQFFTTFDRFGGIKGVLGEWLDEVATRAAAQNEQYLEIMHTPSFSNAGRLATAIGWPADFNDDDHMEVLAKLRDALLAGGLRDEVATDSAEFGEALKTRDQIEHCEAFRRLGDDPDPHPSHGEIIEMEEAGTSNGCSVQIRFLFQVLRGFAPQQVFAQTLLGFELASAHPEQVVGINFVRAEDRRDAMAEYHTEMLMLDYLHAVYPKVHISLHAGELAPGLVPPQGLTFHIREAVELGHAERIGHGVDVLYETNVRDNGLIKETLTPVLQEMAAKHIDVEINLISNQGILGVTGAEHPLSAYRAAHVPFSLSTDDEGVSRTDLTHNYVQAVLDQGLTYADLKLSARNSLEHSFLPGASLYLRQDEYTRRIPACAAPITAAGFPPGPCKAFLSTSEKATLQYELERRFAAFEASTH